jgi:hypothetical protein
MRHAIVLAFACTLTACFAFGQNSTSTNPDSATAICNFTDQEQLTVRYNQMTLGKKDKDVLGHEVPYGKVWEPGKQPLTLFTNLPLSIGGTNVPIGAYTLYLIPDRKEWTLVVSKNTDMTAAYDKSKDLLRAPMQIGQLPAPESRFSVYFAHEGPGVCTMQVDIADTRAWVPFQQK